MYTTTYTRYKTKYLINLFIIINFLGYTCHGSWQENGTHYVITSPIARKSTDALRYCFIYTINVPNQAQSLIDGAMGHNNHGPTLMKLSGVSESCRRDIIPGIDGRWSFNFTSNGKFN